jgi:hypothetical protein
MNSPRQLEKSKTHGKGNKNYKTVPCTRYASGWCEYGDECWFIHNLDSASSFHNRSSPSTPPSNSFDMSGFTAVLPPLTIPMTPPYFSRGKKSQPCFAFQRHSCSKGDHCPYRHDLSPRSPASSVSNRTSPDRYRATGKQPCFDLMRTGKCPKGDACIFSHEATDRYIQWFKDVDCKLFPMGKCKHGDTCLFKHSNPTLNIDRVAVETFYHRPQPQPSRPPLEDVFQRNQGRRCPFSTETMICTNRGMCHVHGFPFPPSQSNVTSPSSFSLFPSGQGSYHRAKTNSTSSIGSSSSGSVLHAISGSISATSSSSHTSRMSTSSRDNKINADDPLGIMRCIDDSDDEYIVYEAAPFRP